MFSRMPSADRAGAGQKTPSTEPAELLRPPDLQTNHSLQTTRTAPSPLRREGRGEGLRSSAECRAPTALALGRRRQAPSLPNCCVRQTCRPTTHSQTTRTAPSPLRGEGRGEGLRTSAECRAPTALALGRGRQAPSLPNCCVRQNCSPATSPSNNSDRPLSPLGRGLG